MSSNAIVTTTPIYTFSIPPGIGERIWENAWLLFAYGLGLIMNVTLFVLCFHLYKKNYGIIILNQLLINIVYCTTNLIVYIVVYIFITIDVFITQFYFAPNQPFWAFFLYNICDVGAESLLYVQQMALLLLCANRCLTMLNVLWLKPWMSYKMHIVYSAACWAFLTIEYVQIPTYATVYLLVTFIVSLSMCIGLYIKLYLHLRSTFITTNDREHYLQMRSITRIALMQSIIPIFTTLPTTIYLVLFYFVPNFITIYYTVIYPSAILNFILGIPTYTEPFTAILIALSIILALGEMRRKVLRAIEYILPKKLFNKSSQQLFSRNNKVNTTINMAQSTMTHAGVNTITVHN